MFIAVAVCAVREVYMLFQAYVDDALGIDQIDMIHALEGAMRFEMFFNRFDLVERYNRGRIECVVPRLLELDRAGFVEYRILRTQEHVDLQGWNGIKGREKRPAIDESVRRSIAVYAR